MKNWKIYIVFFFLLLFGTAIIGRLAFLQIVNHGFYKALAQGQQNYASFEKGRRGNIYIQDKDGNLYTLAANRQSPYVFIVPPDVEDEEKVIEELTKILGIEEELIIEKLRAEDSLYETIQKRITEGQEQQIVAKEISGVYIGKEETRHYPYDQLASHVIGFMNQDGEGQYGMEEYYSDILEGKEGIKKTAKNPASYLFLAPEDTLLENGIDTILTLDFNIQTKVEQLLEKAAKNLSIEEGTVIVIDPTSGKILALANFPTFNPNKYFEVDDFEVFQNAALQKLHEPGSVFKAITMASALDSGRITPETTYVDKGSIKIGGRTIYNYDERVYGKQTMTEVLQFSINTGSVFAEGRLGHREFVNYIDAFGIFRPTKIDLAGEIYSENREFKKGYDINYATASFGQGIEMTPVQFIRAFSVLANEGETIQPYIVEKFIDEKGLLTTRAEDFSPKRVISKDTSSVITSMLVSVTEEGFAKSARVPGYYIAGKTGTAQISWSALGVSKTGYSDKTIQSFIGYAPAYDPQFLVLVKLDNPATRTAEYSAVPIFQELAKFIIDYYQIPPDYDA